MADADLSELDLILGNSNKRFSGVTSTLLQVLPHQQQGLKLAVLGPHHLPEGTPTLTFWQMVKFCRQPRPSGKPIVFHARRNDEMIQALLAKWLFGAELKIAFTSTAQRHHSHFTKWLMSKMDSIITTCSAAGSYLDPPADVTIPHGTDITRFSPTKNRVEAWKALGFPGKRGIGIFGRIRSSKGIDTFVDAVLPLLKDDPDLTAIICGETLPKFESYQSELQQKIDQAGLSDRCLFIGTQPFERLPQLFKAMTIVVAASRNEGFGLTVLEAMACGTPVVATEAGAWKDIITDSSLGECVPVDNSKAMELALRKVLNSDIEAMAVATRAHIKENYRTENEAEKLCKHLKSVAG